jgi:hypothetical protein
MILLLLHQEPHDLRGVLCHTLGVSDVQKVADLEVSGQCLHSLFPSLFHQFGDLLYPFLGEGGSILLSQSGNDHLDMIHGVQFIRLVNHSADGHLFPLGSSGVLIFFRRSLMLGDDRFRLLGREGVRCIAKRLRLELQVHVI